MQEILCGLNETLQPMFGTGFSIEEVSTMDKCIEGIDHTYSTGVVILLLAYRIDSALASEALSKHNLCPLLNCSLHHPHGPRKSVSSHWIIWAGS